MKFLIAVALTLTIPSIACAETVLNQWQTTALDNVKEYPRVKGAQWQSETLLWLFADDADVAWDNIADQVSCNHLRAAGMPAGSRIMVAFYDNREAAQGRARKMGYALCK